MRLKTAFKIISEESVVTTSAVEYIGKLQIQKKILIWITYKQCGRVN